MKEESQIQKILETKILANEGQVKPGDKKILASIMAKHLVKLNPTSKKAIGVIINGMASSYSKQVVPLMDVAGNDYWKEKIKEHLQEIRKKKPSNVIVSRKK